MNTKQHYDVSVQAHAKCILLGAHAVLRGNDALVYPIADKQLTIAYRANTEAKLEADYAGLYGESLLIVFWNTLEKALNKLERSLSEIHGSFLIENHIPMGAGLGFSAAISVAITRWLVWRGWVDADAVFSFARSVEDFFHGTSSGVDIIGAMAEQPMCFNMDGKRELVQQCWQPSLYLSYCNAENVTTQGIKTVEQLWQEDPRLAKAIDEDMASGVALASTALNNPDKTQAYQQLAQAIDAGERCFSQWGLIPDELATHIHQLKSHGAHAKPTGAGLGGYVLSLWSSEPPQDLGIEFIKIG